MRPNVYRFTVRHHGILINMAYQGPNRPRKAVILAHGLPSSPPKPLDHEFSGLLRSGFMIAIPQYIGTFDSYGRSNIENCVDTILDTISLIKRGRATELFGMRRIGWRATEIVLIGGSFGGSVVLVAGAKSRYASKIIAIAPPTDYRDQGKRSEYAEERISDERCIMKRVQPFTWRLSDGTWRRLENGSLDINAVDYAGRLSSKRVLLIHGKEDDAVNFNRSVDLYERIKGGGAAKLMLIKNEGHMNLKALDKPEVYRQVIEWIKSD
jgi:pimeloyl-ACP methyl ester carboxylesterase